MLNETASFPSAISHVLGDWHETLHPVQFKLEGNKVAVGKIVQSNNLPSFKGLNLRAESDQFKQLLIAAALQAGASGEINLVIGFPRETLKDNTEKLKNLKGKKFQIELADGSTKEISLNLIWPQYESIGHAYGLKNVLNLNGRFFALSGGFGTVEGVMIGEDGKPITSSLFGENLGIRRAALLMKNELSKMGIITPDGAGDDLWYDDVLRRSYYKDQSLNILTSSGVVSNETLHKLSIEMLETYANKVLIPKLEQHLKEHNNGKIDFGFTGGASRYEPVANSIKKMIRNLGMNWLEVNDDLALKSAAIGYACVAKSREEFSKNTLVVDLGNSNTVFVNLI
ncbi:MAG: hypothetical protein K2X69_08965 [Silvanigrellaceae bacterium]|nr:hypothetical protein [Silvanigrellaceae bacterium]